MRAERFREWGSAPVIENVPEPVRADGEVLVEVRASAVSHQDLPEKVPDDWLELRGTQSPVELPRLMRDDPTDYPLTERATHIADRNRRITEQVLEKVLPLIH